MTTRDFVFQGEVFTCRIVKDNEGFDLIIGGLKFLDALQQQAMDDPMEGFASKKTESFFSFSQSYLFVVEIIYDNRLAFFRAPVRQIIYSIWKSLCLGVLGNVLFQCLPVIKPLFVVYFFV